MNDNILMWCDECKALKEVYVKTEKVPYYINGESFYIELKRCYCCDCNSIIN